MLVSEPFLRDGPFSHSVVMIVDRDAAGGTAGLVLNHVSDLTLNQCFEGAKPLPLFLGGPVGTDRLSFLHTLGDVITGTNEISPGLWAGGEIKEVLSFINSSELQPGMIRFFLGYSGWSPGQLEDEIKEHTWVVAPEEKNPEDLLSHEGDEMWHHVVKSLGTKFRPWLFHPQNLHLN